MKDYIKEAQKKLEDAECSGYMCRCETSIRHYVIIDEDIATLLTEARKKWLEEEINSLNTYLQDADDHVEPDEVHIVINDQISRLEAGLSALK